jgi:glutaredoxin-related protein
MKTLNEIDNELSVLEEKLQNVKGRDTEVYTRIVGYHRAVTNWNKGKREEYKDRVTFKYDKKGIDVKLKNIKETEEDINTNEVNISSGNIAFYKMFYSQTCRNCPPVKEFAKKLPIPGEEVDVSTDLGLNSARKYNVMSTPTVILFDENDHIINEVHSVDELKKIFDEKEVSVAV